MLDNSSDADNSLENFYDEIYENGKETFYDFSKNLIYSEVYKTIKNKLISRGKMLDLGCGDGDFLKRYVMLSEPEEVYGYDFSDIGIQKAKENAPKNIKFRDVSLEDLKFQIQEGLYDELNSFNVITSIGVIEHLDDPEILFYLVDQLLTKESGGMFVLEHPNFLNVRGVIWKTLEIFANAKMSLTDKHTILPDRIFDYMEKYGFECEKIKTFDYSRGLYDRMVEDLSKRIKLALEGKVSNLDDKVRQFLDYLQFITHEEIFISSPANGAEVIWILKRKGNITNE